MTITKLRNNTNRKKQPSPNAPFEFFKITVEALTSDDLKDSREHLSDKDNDLVQHLVKTLKTHPKDTKTSNSPYFQELEKLRLKYPDSPIILNYLAIGYEHINQKDKARALVFETCEKFPYYLFGRTAKANLFLQEGNLDEAFEALGKALTIKQLYPHRDVFHTSEVKVFEHILVCYFCYKQDLTTAEHHFNLIEKIALELLENPSDPIFIQAKNTLQMSKTLLGFQKRYATLADKK